MWKEKLCSVLTPRLRAGVTGTEQRVRSEPSHPTGSAALSFSAARALIASCFAAFVVPAMFADACASFQVGAL